MTRWFEVLVEGASDAPVLREIFTRRFKLKENQHFRVHGHKGKGKLPSDLVSGPPVQLQGLLDQLPAKLRGFSFLGDDACVVVVVDADGDAPDTLRASLHQMRKALPRSPARVRFHLAIEETESWFIADTAALRAAYPKIKTAKLQKVTPDSIVGAWELLASALGIDRSEVTGATKFEWAMTIAPYLDLDEPTSPSLKMLINDLEAQLRV